MTRRSATGNKSGAAAIAMGALLTTLFVTATLLAAAQPVATGQSTLKPASTPETIYITRVDTVRVPAPTSDQAASFDRQVKFYDFTLKVLLGFLTLVGVVFTVVGVLGFRDIRQVRKSAKTSADKMLEELKADCNKTILNFMDDIDKRRAELTDKANEQLGKLASMAGPIEAEMRQQIAAACLRLKADAEVRVGDTTKELVTTTRDRLARTEEELKSRFRRPRAATGPEEPTDREKRALALMEQAQQACDKGEYAAAVARYTEALKLNPASVDAYLGRGYALVMQKDYREAAEDYAAAARLDAGSYEAFNNWGNALDELARLQSESEATATFREAFVKFERAAEIELDDETVFYNWGLALDELARRQTGSEAIATFREACAKYQRAAELKPDYHLAFYNWGSALLGLARLLTGTEQTAAYRDACEKYQRATELKPDYHLAFYNWACASALAGDKDRAFELLLKLKAEAPAEFEVARTDADLAALHDDPRWKQFFGQLGAPSS